MDVSRLPVVVQEHQVQRQVHKTLLGLNCRVAKTFSSSKLIFISLKDFLKDISELSIELPHDFDVICAIPRTGLIVGAYLSEAWDVPLSTPALVRQGLCWPVSSRIGKEPVRIKRVLLIDDSAGSGLSLVKAEKLIRQGLNNVDIVKAAVIVSLQTKGKVDYYQRVIHGVDGVFEWSLPSSRYAKWRIASDLDGVICTDASDPRLVKPLFIPSWTFEAIISARPEKERLQIVAWLEKHNVKYRALKLEADKVEELKKLKPAFYIESDDALAKFLWTMTRIPVLCYSTMTMYS